MKKTLTLVALSLAALGAQAASETFVRLPSGMPSWSGFLSGSRSISRTMS